MLVSDLELGLRHEAGALDEETARQMEEILA